MSLYYLPLFSTLCQLIASSPSFGRDEITEGNTLRPSPNRQRSSEHVPERPTVGELEIA